jgi:WD40 repeat protein
MLAMSSFDDGKAVLFDPFLGKTLRVLTSPAVSLSLAFSPDGRILAGGGRDGNISLWDVATGQRKVRLEGELGPVFSVAFSPDGTLLASTGTAGPQVKLWDASTGRLVHLIKGHHLATNTVAFSPDGKTLASGGSDGMLRLWDVATGQQRMYTDGRSAVLRNVVFSPDGRLLAATAHDSDIRLWEVAELTDNLTDARGSGGEADHSSSNNPAPVANSYSGSAPPPVYSVGGLRARSIEPDLCLDG